MQLEVKKYLFDVRQACARIREFNILVHAYAEIDDRLVWGVVEANLPRLTTEVEALLGRGDGG